MGAGARRWRAARDFFVSGFADGEEELGGTAVVTDERAGAGRVIAFAVEPNFRGFTDGTQKILRSALLGPDPAVAGAARKGARPSARVAVRRPGATRFTIANPRGWQSHEHPYSRELAADLRRSRVPVVAFSAP